MALDFLILYEHTVREYESDLCFSGCGCRYDPQCQQYRIEIACPIAAKLFRAARLEDRFAPQTHYNTLMKVFSRVRKEN